MPVNLAEPNSESKNSNRDVSDRDQCLAKPFPLTCPGAQNMHADDANTRRDASASNGEVRRTTLLRQAIRIPYRRVTTPWIERVNFGVAPRCSADSGGEFP